MTIIVDLDDTLVYSTELNNDAYNYALEYYNYKRIKTNGRITRNSLKIVDKQNFNKIIALKQKYFCEKWLFGRVVLNGELLNKIKKSQCTCYLWTKANKFRALKTIEALKLKNCFSDIIFDKKDNYADSVNLLINKTGCNEFVVYENDSKFFKNQPCKIIDSIKNAYFDVKGYYIKAESEKSA